MSRAIQQLTRTIDKIVYLPHLAKPLVGEKISCPRLHLKSFSNKHLLPPFISRHLGTVKREEEEENLHAKPTWADRHLPFEQGGKESRSYGVFFPILFLFANMEYGTNVIFFRFAVVYNASLSRGNKYFRFLLL